MEQSRDVLSWSHVGGPHITGEGRQRTSSRVGAKVLADASWTPPPRRADGRDANRIGAWPAKGLRDTRPGSNRSGRQW